MTESNPGILGDASPLDISASNLPKRSHLHHLELNNGTLVAFDNPNHYVSNDIAVAQGPLNLDSEIVANTRTAAVNSSTISPLQSSSVLQTSANQVNNYSSIEYVGSSVIPIQDDHHSKFSDNLVHSGVEFVEMNDAGLKSGPGPPIDFYLEVMSSTSAPNNSTSPPPPPSFLPRHEHQAPKAQLLVRAYSDFIQSNEQHISQSQHQTHQHQPPIQIHSSESLNNSENPNPIMTDVLQVNFAHLEQAVIANPVESYRKPCKGDLPKRPFHLHVTQKQLHSLSRSHLDDNLDPSGHKIAIEHQAQHPLTHESDAHSPQIQLQLQDHQGQSFVSAHQRHPLTQKTFTHNSNDQEYFVKEEISNLELSISDPKNLPEHSILPNQHHNVGSLPKHVEKTAETQHLTTHHMPLVSRSGRPIRRRQEYIEYVNDQNEQDQPHHYNRDVSHSVKIESISQEFDEEGPAIEELFEDDDNEADNSNGEDHDSSSTYNSNGKKSLPHKKRIARKLKNVKKAAKVIKCLECDLQFSNYIQLNSHKTTQHLNHLTNTPAIYACELCPRIFDTQIKFFEHLKVHYEPSKKHKCEVCDGEFSSLESLQEHLTMHSGEHFQCSICHKTFRKESLLEFHIKNVHLEDNEGQSSDMHYSCTSCPKSFRTQMTLDTHMLNEHVDNPSEFNCEDCYRAFKTKAKLASHRKTEHKEELSHGKVSNRKKGKGQKANKASYPCPHCPRTFTHKNSLIYHIRVHTGERPHQCDQCGKAFYAASALKVHLRRHTGEKPYKCEHCEKYFRQWGDLRYHTSSVHSDARQFQCEFCGKDFKRKYCLVVHRRIHTGEKKYECDFCPKSFRASSYLQNHRRIHTGERPYPCPDCGKPFRVRSDMRRHRHTHMRGTNTNGSSNNQCNVRQNKREASNTMTTQTVNQMQVSSDAPQAHHPAILARQSSNHSQVQILQGTVSQGSLIIAEGVQTVLGENNQPIRIVVSGLPAQTVTHSSIPPPAHRHSQVSTSSNGSASLVPNSTSNSTNTANPSTPVTSDVLIMEEGANHCVFVLEN